MAHSIVILGTETRIVSDKQMEEKLVKHEFEVEEISAIEIDGKLIYTQKKGVIAAQIKP